MSKGWQSDTHRSDSNHRRILEMIPPTFYPRDKKRDERSTGTYVNEDFSKKKDKQAQKEGDKRTKKGNPESDAWYRRRKLNKVKKKTRGRGWSIYRLSGAERMERSTVSDRKKGKRTRGKEYKAKEVVFSKVVESTRVRNTREGKVEQERGNRLLGHTRMFDQPAIGIDTNVSVYRLMDAICENNPSHYKFISTPLSSNLVTIKY